MPSNSGDGRGLAPDLQASGPVSRFIVHNEIRVGLLSLVEIAIDGQCRQHSPKCDGFQGSQPSAFSNVGVLEIIQGQKLPNMPRELLQEVITGSTPVWRAWGGLGVLVFLLGFGISLTVRLWLPATPTSVVAVIEGALMATTLAPLIWWWLFRPLQRITGARNEFLGELFESIEEDRRRVAHELHDGIGQSMTLLVSGLKSLPEMDNSVKRERRTRELIVSAERTLQEVKEMARGLRPSLLDDLGLTAAIERVAAETFEFHQLPVTVTSSLAVGERLPPSVETAVFRIFQEALQNVVRHAKATCAAVRIQLGTDNISLEVKDDGVGMITAQHARTDRVPHLGLIGMTERAALLGGYLWIDSPPGYGTIVSAEIPLKASGVARSRE